MCLTSLPRINRPASALSQRSIKSRRMDLGVIYKREKGARPQQYTAIQAAAPLAKLAGRGAWGNRERERLWVPAMIMGSKMMTVQPSTYH